MYLPDDLREALSASPEAEDTFNSLSERLQYFHVKHVVETSDPIERNARLQHVIKTLSEIQSS